MANEGTTPDAQFQYTGVGIAIGAGLGVAIGAVFGGAAIAIGTGIGAGVGVALGAALDAWRSAHMARGKHIDDRLPS